DHVTSLHDFRVRIHLDAELNVPFFPLISLIYLSIFPLFWISPFVLHSRAEVKATAESLIIVILISGIFFLLVPSEPAYTPLQPVGIGSYFFQLADRINLQYNMVPSLHVALSLVCIDIYCSRARITGRILLWSWAILVCVSTLLTHQHHLLDVLTGMALAPVASRLIFPRLLLRSIESN
ncbi:MAG: phosphatase PAP2 family protein, partial [Planctomycetales bacterium]